MARSTSFTRITSINACQITLCDISTVQKVELMV
jgi:hypothetical protein